MTDWNEHEDAICDAISDSIDMDWTSRNGAKSVVAWLNENAAAPAPSSLAGGEVLSAGERAFTAWGATSGADGTGLMWTWGEMPASQQERWAKIALAALSPEAPAREGSVPADVARLVIAARLVAFGDQPPHADDIKALEIASEAFADRVPWEDEPENDEALAALKAEGA